MFNSTVLDVAIGLIFIYLVLSLVCTSLNEAIAQFLGLRAEILVDAIHGMFSGPDAHRLGHLILNHELVLSNSYTAKPTPTENTDNAMGTTCKPPSYLDSNMFSLALTGVLNIKDPAHATNAGDSLLKQLDSAPFDPKTLSILQPMIASANNDLDKARKNIEAWYDNVMQRASGWYKKRLQIITFFVAAILVVVINGDTLMVSSTLLSNTTARTAAVNAATTLDKSPPAAPTSGTTGTTGATTAGSGTTAGAATQPVVGENASGSSEAAASSGPDAGILTTSEKSAATNLIGWSSSPNDPRSLPKNWPDWGRKVLGLLITIFAASLGAPFWFDALNKIMNIRSAGASPTETEANVKPGDPGRIPHEAADTTTTTIKETKKP